MKNRDSEIDDVIERAVRDMTALEPRPDLRQRVLRQLEPRRPVWFTLPRLAAATFVAAALVLVLLPIGPAPHPVREQTIADAPRPPVVSRGPHVLESSPPRVDPPPRTSRRRSSVQPPAQFDPPLVSAAGAGTAGGVAIEPLASIDPIALSPVRPPAMPPTSEIVIPPIEVEQLEIGPLSPPR